MLALISFIGVILIVVSIHEYGHYLAARWCGVRVLRFSVGFGKPLLSRTDRGGTEWVFAPILLGGYVRLLDKEALASGDYSVDESVEAQSPPRRILIYAAGPLANIVLAFAILLVLLAGGERGLQPQVDKVRSASAAAAAGIQRGSDITVINDSAIAVWRQVEVALADAIIAGDEIHIDNHQGGSHVIPAERLTFADIEKYGGAAAAAGLYPYEDYIKLEIATVLPNSPAAQAGIAEQDELVMLGTVVVEHWREAVDVISRYPERPLPLIVWRAGQVLTLTVTPLAIRRGGKEVGYLGVAPAVDREDLAARLITVSYSPPQLVAAAAAATSADIGRALSFLRLLAGGDVSPNYISGPVGIAAQSGEAANRGILVWLRFVTLISISLAIINLLPLPLLDGGQIVLTVLQWIMRRDISETALRWWQILGAVTILSLMLFVIVNDIVQLL